MKCPFSTWRGSPNVGGTPVRPAKGLVVHVEVGTEAGTNTCFQNPSFQASAHFGCAKDGSLDQWVDTDQVAWAEVAGNHGWISVETEGTPDEPLTDAQVVSIARLLTWLQAIYKFPFQTCDHDGTGLTTHAHYPSGVTDASWGGHPCPGTLRSAQLPAILHLAMGGVHPQGGDKTMLESVDPKNGTFVLVDPVGAVFTFGPQGQPSGGHYLGGLNNHPEYNAGDGKPEGPPVGVHHYDDGNAGVSAYIIVTRDSSGGFHPYNFPSSGALAH